MKDKIKKARQIGNFFLVATLIGLSLGLWDGLAQLGVYLSLGSAFGVIVCLITFRYLQKREKKT